MKKIIFVSIFLLFGTSVTFAQSYSPDRPGIGTGSFITPQNIIGVEAGLEYSTNSLFQQFTGGQVLLRYGILEKLEARAYLGSYTSLTISLIGEDETLSGHQDMSLGAKYNLLSGTDKPNLSILADVSLPVGHDEVTTGEVIPSFAFLADHSITDDFSVSSNLGYSFGVGDLDDRWLFTLTPGISIGENMSAYGGYAGVYDGVINEHWIEGGFTFGLESGAQLDLNLGYENENETFFIGAGFALGF